MLNAITAIFKEKSVRIDVFLRWGKIIILNPRVIVPRFVVNDSSSFKRQFEIDAFNFCDFSHNFYF